jgi:hypothetical protein
MAYMFPVRSADELWVFEMEKLGYLATAHGTLLNFDEERDLIRHVKAIDPSSCCWHLTSESWVPQITHGNLDNFLKRNVPAKSSSEPHEWEQISPSEFALKISNVYMCAEPDGTITFSRGSREIWETFFFIDAATQNIEAVLQVYPKLCLLQREFAIGNWDELARLEILLRDVSFAPLWHKAPRTLVDEFLKLARRVYRTHRDKDVFIELLLNMRLSDFSAYAFAVCPLPGTNTARAMRTELKELRLPRTTRSASEFTHLSNAHVVGGDWIAHAQSVGVVRHSEGYHLFHSKNDGDSYVKLNVEPVSLEIEEPVILLGGSNNYYHNLLDFVINLYYYFNNRCDELIDHRPDKFPAKFLTGILDQRFQTETLNFFGIDPRQCIELKLGEVAFCRDLVLLPQTVTNFGNVRDVKPTRWVTRLAINNKLSLHRNRIYISRDRAALRRFENEQEVQSLMVSLDIAIIYLEELDISEQLYLFSQADLVVGMHGAGMANLVSSRPGTIVVEIVPPGVAMYFHRICVGLNLRWNPHILESNALNAEYYSIDCAALSERIKNLILI